MMIENIEIDQIWKVALAQIEVKLDNPTHFKTWFADTSLLEIENHTAIVGVKNHYNAEWLKKKHHDLLKNTLKYVSKDKEIEVIYEISHEHANDPIPTFTPKEDQLKTEDDPSLLDVTGGSSGELNRALTRAKIDSKKSFENYVVGDSNNMVHAAAKAVAESPGEIYNPLFIYGSTGLGKTHLAQAIARRILEKNVSKKIVYVPAETFMNKMVAAIRSGNTKRFRDKFRDSVDVFIIDDIQFISSWEKTQTEFFNTFNALYSDNKQIIIISDRPPEELEKLTPRLKSRFQGGLVADLSRPDYEHRLAILQRKVELLNENIKIPDFAVQFIAKNVTDNIRELEGALQKVVLMASISRDTITEEEIAKQLGKDIESKRKSISNSEVIKRVAKEFEIKSADIKGKRRTKDVALARQICMYIFREELNFKLEEIANFVNRKDHTTIMHGIDKIKSMRMTDESFREQLMQIIEDLQTS